MALESDIAGIVSVLNVSPRWDRYSANSDLSYDGVPEHVRGLRCSTREKLQRSVNESRRAFASMVVPSLTSRISKALTLILSRSSAVESSAFEELSDAAFADAILALLSEGMIEEHAPVTQADRWMRDKRGVAIPDREKILFLLSTQRADLQADV